MPVHAVEAFADAIMTREGFRPGTVSYVNRNPGNLKASKYASSKDFRGFCVFKDFPTGYHALCEQLTDKCMGRTQTGLGPKSTLLQFFNVYAPGSDNNDPRMYALFVAQWLSRALGKQFDINTKLEDIYTEAVQK